MEKKTSLNLMTGLSIFLIAFVIFLFGLNFSKKETGQAILYCFHPEEFSYSQGEHFFAGTKGIPFHKGDSVIGEKICLNEKGFVYRDSYIKESPYSGVVFDGIVNPTQEEVAETFERDVFIHGIHCYVQHHPLTDRPYDVLPSQEMKKLYHQSFTNF